MTRTIISFALLLGIVALVSCAPAQDQAQPTGQAQPQGQDAAMAHPNVEVPTRGVVVLRSMSGSDVTGELVLEQHEGYVQVTGTVRGLTPGEHGFHIHEFGDLRADDGTSAGGHYNPGNHPHGGPDDAQHHAGDMGNIEANAEGVATVDKRAEGLQLHMALGRAVVVHAGRDDLTSQPSGDAGARVGVGVIGIAGPASGSGGQ